MRSKAIENLLDRLRLSGTGTTYFFSQESKWRRIVSSETAKKLDQIRPDAFYIFNNQPYILFFDLTNSLFETGFEEAIHKKVWSFDQSPLAIILKDTDVEVYNAFQYEKKRQKLQRIKTENVNLDKLFSFWNLQSGQTWDWIKDEYYKNTIKQKRVSQKLFENIKAVREKLIVNQHLDEGEANTLILRLIFIRYLIDRNVKLPPAYIKGDNINERRLSFIDLIGKPRILNNFFSALNDKFNGVLFKNIKFELSKEQALALAGVFSGETAVTGSLFYGIDFYFEIFDFSIIPVELISGIYESLIDPETRKLHSAVYTPSFLVEYMLSETIDDYFTKNYSKTECKIFDPAVGSGIFLVQAYRKMVEREIEKEGSVKPSKVRLREIAVNNLFGIDINEQALKVTCFSIYVAMLDYIDPASILVSFKFPDLIDNNLFKADFFDTSHTYNQKILSKKITFILGNPPWKSDKNDHHITWLTQNSKTVGRFEIAQSFLLRSKEFMDSNTVAALIVTSTIFYNVSNTTKKFKTDFLSTFCINTFFDLSPVRRLIFEEKNNPCSIVFYRLSDEESHPFNTLKHQSIKSNIFLKYFKTLVIEKFDQKRILQKHFIENDWMFKVALYGGPLDYNFVRHLELGRKSIRSQIDNKTTFKGGGIHKGTKEKYPPFNEILGKPVIENIHISPIYSKASNTETIKSNDIYIKSGREIGMFEGCQILVKEQAKNESEVVISLTDKPYVVRSGVFSIASTINKPFVKTLFGLMISRLYEYYIYMTSGSWGVSTRPQIRLDEEFLRFPWINIDEQNQVKIINLVERIIEPHKKHHEVFNLGEAKNDIEAILELNRLIETLYDVQGFQRDLIDYVLSVSRYQFQESKQNKILCKVNNDDMQKYIDVFIKEFENIYEEERLKVDIYSLDHFVAVNFVFQEHTSVQKVTFVNDVSDVSEIFKILSSTFSISKHSKDLYIQKDIKGFERNSFYIIKPNEYKCWHRAMAWYDVAEIKEAIEAAEIHHLNHSWDAS